MRTSQVGFVLDGVEVIPPASHLPLIRASAYEDFLSYCNSFCSLLNLYPQNLLSGTMSAVAAVDSAYALTAASYAIILTRILLRRLKHERLLSDDYLMLFSMVFYALNTTSWPITVSNESISCVCQANIVAELLRDQSHSGRSKVFDTRTIGTRYKTSLTVSHGLLNTHSLRSGRRFEMALDQQGFLRVVLVGSQSVYCKITNMTVYTIVDCN